MGCGHHLGTDEVVESEIISGRQSQPIPLKAATETKLDIDAAQLRRSISVMGGGDNALGIEKMLRLGAQLIHLLIILAQPYLQLRTGEEKEPPFFSYRVRVIRAHGYNKVMLVDMMPDILNRYDIGIGRNYNGAITRLAITMCPDG